MDRVLVSIGPITIYWYSFLIFLSILIGLVINYFVLSHYSAYRVSVASSFDTPRA